MCSIPKYYYLRYVKSIFLCIKFEEDFSILLNNVYFQIIKRNFFYKIILTKTRSAVTLKFRDSGVQPERLSQIKLQADLIQSVKYFVSARFLSSVLDNGIFYHAVVFPFLCP